ncbi:MAG TPA: DUF1203 domain-containing protein [Gemmatimonadales bacterium]
MSFRIAGIPSHLAAEVRQTLRSPQYGHPAHRETASGYGPCRLCLRTFNEGVDERILFTYQPFSDPGSVPAPGPVFIHAGPCERYDAPDLPPDLRRLPLLFEAYGAGGELLGRERVRDQAAEAVLERLFVATRAGYVHIRNEEAGCFMARVDRLRAGD